MCSEAIDASRLYALIGESVRLLPADAVAILELTLAAREQRDTALAPIQIRNRSAPPSALRLPAGNGLSDQQREALGAILEILHSAQQEPGEGFGDALDSRLVEGLITAGRLIVA